MALLSDSATWTARVLKSLRDCTGAKIVQVPLTTVRHLSSSSHLSQVKASSETQDVKSMDTLLKAVRKSFATVLEFTSFALTPLSAGARSNPAYRKYALRLGRVTSLTLL